MFFQKNEGLPDTDMHKAHYDDLTRPARENQVLKKKYPQVLLAAKACLALNCTQVRLASASQEHVPVYPHGLVKVAPTATQKKWSQNSRKTGIHQNRKTAIHPNWKNRPPKGE